MNIYLPIALVSFTFLAYIWSSSGMDALYKAIFTLMAIWSFVLLLTTNGYVVKVAHEQAHATKPAPSKKPNPLNF